MFLGNYSYHPKTNFRQTRLLISATPSPSGEGSALCRLYCMNGRKQSNERAKKVSRFILGMCPVLGIALRWVVCLDVILGYYSVRSFFSDVVKGMWAGFHYVSAH